MTPPIPFETYRSSDVDGSAMLVVDGTKMDLTGWTAELRDDRDDKVTVTGFESRNAPRLDDGTVTVNPYMDGEWVPCWQVCVMGSNVVAFIDPDGVRYGEIDSEPVTTPQPRTGVGARLRRWFGASPAGS